MVGYNNGRLQQWSVTTMVGYNNARDDEVAVARFPRKDS